MLLKSAVIAKGKELNSKLGLRSVERTYCYYCYYYYYYHYYFYLPLEYGPMFHSKTNRAIQLQSAKKLWFG